MTAAGAVRTVIAVSACAALAVNLLLVSRAWQAFLVIPIIAAAAAVAANTRWPSVTRGTILFLAATTPALLRVGWDAFDLTNGGLWLVPLLAVTLAGTGAARWSLPRLWVLPLALFALAVAVSWPIVLLREADFAIGALTDYQTAVTSQGLPVPVTSGWIAHVAAAHMVGVLWLDGLYARYAGDRRRFEREIAWPIIAAVLVSVAVGIYQAALDPAFLNPTVFGAMGRASGLLLDGNVLGILAAMVLPALFVATYRAAAPWRIAALVGAAACLAAAWGSGSRTALLAAACVLPMVAVAIWTGSKTWLGRIALLATAVAVLGGTAALAWSGRLSGPMDRVWLVLERSWAANESLVEYLWNRDGYGPAALRMIEEHPLPGVGVGSFHSLVLDYSRREDAALALSTDNAQNWLRHVAAELGVLGSLGIVVFALMLSVVLIRPAPRGSRVEAWLIASALAGVAAASLLGVPTQHAFVLIVFWAFVAWHGLVSAREGEVRGAPVSRWGWLAVFALALMFAAATAEAARDELRVSHRAVRFGWPYHRGFHRAESGFSWTRQHAKAVIPAQAGYLQLTYFVHHDDVAQNPVRVTIRVQGVAAVEETLHDQHPRTVYVPVAPGVPSLTIESSVSRPWFPPNEGGTRELGLGLADFTFVHRPPDGAVVIR